MMILYGIPNCDATKKAMDWLKKNGIDFSFHNYKEAGISATKLNEWSRQAGWKKVLNKRSTTWRELSAQQQQTVKDQESAVLVMQANNSIIKRPVTEYKGKVLIGFDQKEYEALLTK